MNTVAMEQRKRIHPHKFTLWVGIASIVMMFAGLTSAYIVKRNQVNWITFEIPTVFWVSTVAIVASSVTIWMAQNAFKKRAMAQYRTLMIATLALGVLFLGLQVVGFNQLWESGMTLTKNVSFSFLYIIVGLHGLHVIGGLIALLILFAKAFSSKMRNYDIVPVEVMATYWHFVDLLWIYLLIFLIMIK
ncbi:heme-copper oxidase subunit III [Ferruginibacter lapsinanis]|uniref:cytochrome c oxidase subunit 3 n=1 Tax=Ferruginibacter lapsinanis TaxID=563172 RepID=UPI001E4A285F|nr:heme-copper oxidase subunit III [Ferruginibacter lapsinanis]UEG50693.1 heme-copper oxidase subunit III [Ferruginibacter lapsinanis]